MKTLCPCVFQFSWIASALIWGGTAQAQVRVSPLVIELEANEGQCQGIINVTNNTPESFQGRIYAEPFTYDRDSGFQSLTSSPSDLTPYLGFSPRELVVPPGVTQLIQLNSCLPPHLPEGEYRAVVFTEQLNKTNDTRGNNVSIATRIGVTIYVRQGDVSPNLVVERAKWNPQRNQIQLLVRNTGQASARSRLSWRLVQGESVIKTGNLDVTTIVAQSERNILLNYPTEFQPALTVGEYQLSGELIWGEDKNQTSLPFSVNFTIPESLAD